MAQPTRPTPDPNHESLKPDNSVKGSYYRRLVDIRKGLRAIDEASLPPGGRFMFLYYGCEKLGRGIIGIAKQWPACDAYDEYRPFHLDELKVAMGSLVLRADDAELELLFVNDKITKKTARFWRNEIAHNFGPSNVNYLVQHSGVLNGKMHDFLTTYTPQVLGYLSKKYAKLLT